MIQNKFMAFPQPNVQRELANRKILEEIQLKKQLLLKQGVQATTNSNNLASSLLPQVIPTGGVGFNQTAFHLQVDHSLTSAQRTALNTAHNQSYGFFITQDSAFGNLILPVLPRFDVK